MKITINKSALESIVSSLQPFVEKRDLSAVTSHILIVAQNGEVILKATDYEMGLIAKIHCEQIDEDGLLTLNGKKFLDTLKNLRDDNITIQSKVDKKDEPFAEIKQGKAKINLMCFIAEEFPKSPENYQSSKINIDSKNLIESLKKLVPVIEINNPRTEYRNALIDMREYEFNLVATDTKRLEVITFSNQSVEKQNFMFPKKAIVEVQKLFSEDAQIYFNDNNIILENDKFTFWTRIPNGNFIDYKKVIPKDIKYKIQIDKDKMLEALKIINSITHQVKLIFDKDKISFESIINDYDDKAFTEIELDSEQNKDFIDNFSESVEISINSKHILDFIPFISTQFFEFGINEKVNAACVLKSENFVLTMMPIIV